MTDSSTTPSKWPLVLAGGAFAVAVFALFANPKEKYRGKRSAEIRGREQAEKREQKKRILDVEFKRLK